MIVWGITDGNAGNIAQVQALAHAMGEHVEMHHIRLTDIWKKLPNQLFDTGLGRIIPVSDYVLPAFLPDLVISCGRKGGLLAAYVRMISNRHALTRFVHIHDPQMHRKHFDLILAMAHDKIEGENVVKTPYALTYLLPEKLAVECKHWEPKFSHLPRPWNAVLIGGSTNKYQLTKSAMEDLITQIEKIEGSLLITTSRRTGEDNIKMLTQRFGGQCKRSFLYTGEMENPYLGMLGCADHIYVTNDSVNMMSEAVASGKPVTILPLKGHVNTKPARFAESLFHHAITPQEMMGQLAGKVRALMDETPAS